MKNRPEERAVPEASSPPRALQYGTPNTLILGAQYGISDIKMTTEQIQTKTQFGLPIDESFAKPASEESIQNAAKALKAHNFSVEVVDTLAQARAYVNSILPKDQSILTASSETVRLSGLDEDINRSGKFNAIRLQLEKLDRSTQRAEMRRISASPDVVVGKRPRGHRGREGRRRVGEWEPARRVRVRRRQGDLGRGLAEGGA